MKKVDATKWTDKEIVSLIVNEQKVELLGELYLRYEKKIYYKCFSIVRDEALAKDFAHDIFIKIFSRLSQFKGRSNFSLWVHSISYNYCMDQIKKRKKKKIEYFDPIEHQDIQDQEDSDLEVLRHVQTKHLRYGMHKLKPDERTILLMYYQDDFSVEAISTTLSIGKSAVKMRLKRARDKLTSLVKPLVDHELER